MKLLRLSPTKIEALKREAKKLKKELSCSHSSALDQIASQYGYKNWSLLQKNALFSKGKKVPAHIFKVTTDEYGRRTLEIAVIRIASRYKEDPSSPGQLVFRCPECGEIHYHGAGGWSLGAGDGNRVPHCIPDHSEYSYDLVEVLDKTLAGTLPIRTLKNFKPPIEPQHLYNWYSREYRQVEKEKADSSWPLHRSSTDILNVLVENFPNVDKKRLQNTARKLSKSGFWVEHSLIRELEQEKDQEIMTDMNIPQIIGRVARVERGEIFRLKDIFPKEIWESYSYEQRQSGGKLFYSYVLSLEGTEIAALGKDSANHQLYEKL